MQYNNFNNNIFNCYHVFISQTTEIFVETSETTVPAILIEKMYLLFSKKVEVKFVTPRSLGYIGLGNRFEFP